MRSPDTMDPAPDVAPKLSPALFQAFRAYKRDTARLATWLGDTARSIGFDFNRPGASKTTTTGTSSSAPTSRLKGKARKAAKKEEAAKCEAAKLDARQRQDSGVEFNFDIPKTTGITVAQFIACARFIADSDPPVTVPTRVLEWACRAIQARRVCAEWFSSPSPATAKVPPQPTSAAAVNFADPSDYDHGADRMIDSNKTHAHFIIVLSQVAEILATRVGSPSGGGKSFKAAVVNSSKSMTSVELLESRFAALGTSTSTDEATATDEDDDSADWDAVFDLVKETLASKSTASSSSAKRRTRKEDFASQGSAEIEQLRHIYQIQGQEDDEQEFVFALVELLATLDMLNHQVVDAWQAYLVDHSSGDAGFGALEHASLLALAVCDKAQDMCNDLGKLFPTLMPNFGTYARLLFEHTCSERNLEPWAPSKIPGEKKAFGLHAWQLATHCYLPAITVMERFRKSVQAGTLRHLDRPTAAQCPCCGGDESKQLAFLGYLEFAVNEVYVSSKNAEALHPLLAFSTIPNPVMNALESIKTLPPSEPIPLFTLFVTEVFINMNHQFRRVEHSRAFVRQDFHSSICRHLTAVHAYLNDPPSTSGELYIHETAKLVKDLPYLLYLWPAYKLHKHDPVNFDSLGTDPLDSHGVSRHPEVALRQTMYHVFSINPWLAGLVLVRTGLRMTNLSMTLASNWQSVLNAAYLYEAIRLTGLDHVCEEDKQTAGCGNASGECAKDPESSGDAHEDSSNGPSGIRATAWWQEMAEFMRAVGGKSRVFFGKEPSDLHALWRTLNLTLMNPSRTDTVFRDHLQQPRNGRTISLPRSLRKIVEKHPCKPVLIKSKIMLHNLVGVRRQDLLGELFMDRILDDPAGKLDEHVRIKAVVASLDKAVSPRVVLCNHKKSDAPEYKSTRQLRFFFEHLSTELRDVYTPLLTPNILLLHVQSVRILKYLREQVLVHDKIETMNEDCTDCRWRDVYLPASVWNLIRALGGEEITEPVLGEEETQREKEAALELLADVRNFIVEMDKV